MHNLAEIARAREFIRDETDWGSSELAGECLFCFAEAITPQSVLDFWRTPRVQVEDIPSLPAEDIEQLIAWLENNDGEGFGLTLSLIHI